MLFMCSAQSSAHFPSKPHGHAETNTLCTHFPCRVTTHAISRSTTSRRPDGEARVPIRRGRVRRVDNTQSRRPASCRYEVFRSPRTRSPSVWTVRHRRAWLPGNIASRHATSCSFAAIRGRCACQGLCDGSLPRSTLPTDRAAGPGLVATRDTLWRSRHSRAATPVLVLAGVRDVRGLCGCKGSGRLVRRQRHSHVPRGTLLCAVRRHSPFDNGAAAHIFSVDIETAQDGEPTLS